MHHAKPLGTIYATCAFYRSFVKWCNSIRYIIFHFNGWHDTCKHGNYLRGCEGRGYITHGHFTKCQTFSRQRFQIHFWNDMSWCFIQASPESVLEDTVVNISPLIKVMTWQWTVNAVTSCWLVSITFQHILHLFNFTYSNVNRRLSFDGSLDNGDQRLS